MLTGAVVVGDNGQLWLAALLTGPSLIALAKIFVLCRSDATDMKATPSSARRCDRATAGLNRRFGVLSDLGAAARVTDLAEAASGLASRSEARRCGP